MLHRFLNSHRTNFLPFVLLKSNCRLCFTEETQEESSKEDSPHPFIQFKDDFMISQKDYYLDILKEAHLKHRVPLSVPPQLNPPTDEHVPVYTDILELRMQTEPSKFVFAPLHGNPPTLPEMLDKPTMPSRVQSVPTKPSDPKESTMKPLFRCSVCNRSFRLEQSCVQHLETKHPGEDAKMLKEGMTEEATEKKEKTVRKTKDGLSSGLNPLLELMKGLEGDRSSLTDTATLGDVALYSLPNDVEIDALLCDTWDKYAAPVGGKSFKSCKEAIVGHTDPKEASEAMTLSSVASHHVGSGASGDADTLFAGEITHATSGVFTSPFGAPATPTAKSPSALIASKLERKFHCDLCSRRFRLFDAAVDHYREIHGVPCPPHILTHYKTLDQPWIADSIHKASEEASDALQIDEELRAEEAAKTAVAKLHESIPIVELEAHMRAPNNALMIGQIVDIEFGFLHADAVCQLSLNCEGETVVVRCIGDALAERLKGLTEQQTILVKGTLRLNPQVDHPTGQTYAYPYVMVTTPLGHIQEL